MKRYSAYKDSGVEWIGEVPEHWIMTRIKFLSNGEKNSFIDGNWVELPYITDDGIRLIQTGNIGIGKYKEQGFRYISEDAFSELKCTEVFPNDVLICRLASPVGRGCLAPKLGCRMITAVDNCILKPSPNHDARFIVYQISTSHYLGFIQFISRGGTRSRISRSMLGNINFSSPPLEEQIQIAKYLDHKTHLIDTLIEKKQKQIELLKEQRTAVINQAVTKGLNPDARMKDSGIEWLGEIPEHWRISKIKYAADINPSKNGFVSFRNTGQLVPFLPMEKVFVNGTYDCSFLKPVRELWNGFTFFEEKDVIVAKITPCFENGKGAYLSHLGSPFGFGSTEFHVLRGKSDKVIPEFLYYVISSPMFMIIGETFMTGAAGQKRVPINFIEEFLIGLPSIDEQKRIVDLVRQKMSNINLAVNYTETKIELLKEYRTKLISDVITGKIDVRDEVIP